MNNIVITLLLEKKDELYNPYNETLLSEELSEYLVDQCKSKGYKKDIVINVFHEHNMDEDEKDKLVNCIHNSFKIDLEKNKHKMKLIDKREITFLFLGVIFFILSQIFKLTSLNFLTDTMTILFWVFITEIAYNIFINQVMNRNNNNRLEKLSTCEINFHRKKGND